MNPLPTLTAEQWAALFALIVGFFSTVILAIRALISLWQRRAVVTISEKELKHRMQEYWQERTELEIGRLDNLEAETIKQRDEITRLQSDNTALRKEVEAATLARNMQIATNKALQEIVVRNAMQLDAAARLIQELRKQVTQQGQIIAQQGAKINALKELLTRLRTEPGFYEDWRTKIGTHGLPTGGVK